MEGEIDKNAYIAFSRLDILIDGKPIDEFPVRTLSPLIVDKKINYTGINVDRKIGLEQINEINDKKIIGLGESVHGNDGIKKFSVSIDYPGSGKVKLQISTAGNAPRTIICLQ
ncbi:hypothetical protein NXV19_03725 [Bacteroides fragilis]|nr:hypothetical protein NXV19_03725 [Bacteroides fragilis]